MFTRTAKCKETAPRSMDMSVSSRVNLAYMQASQKKPKNHKNIDYKRQR